MGKRISQTAPDLVDRQTFHPLLLIECPGRPHAKQTLSYAFIISNPQRTDIPEFSHLSLVAFLPLIHRRV
ncbi:hypothetical protein QE435_004239 [Rhizobium sp. SORGH_AS 787]|nr:hypothetical protein [Rhizobium sp. SORGH_AS_0787]